MCGCVRVFVRVFVRVRVREVGRMAERVKGGIAKKKVSAGSWGRWNGVKSFQRK